MNKMLLILLFLVPSIIFAQTTEKFADHTKGAKTFSEGGLTFSATSNLEVDYIEGWGLDDDYFISNFENAVTGGGSVGSFTNSSNNFNVHSLYLITLNASKLVEQYNNILVRGKLNDSEQFTHTIYWNTINTTSTNRYYTYIDLSSYSTYTLDELEFIIEPYGTNDIVYLMIDDFQFEADATLPVELLSFSAASKGNEAELQWATASETDNLGFIIERCTENSGWQQIASYQSNAELTGQGTTSSQTQYSYCDASITAGSSYTYRLYEICTNGAKTEIGTTSAKASAVPTTTQLFAAYPNPFNPSTTLKYNLDKDSNVTLVVFDVLGRQINMLSDQYQSAGEYSIQWDGTTDSGAIAPSGIYMVQMQSNNVNQIQKVLFLK